MEQRPWYKKKRYLISIGILAVLTIAGFDSTPAPSAPTVQSVQATASALQQVVSSDSIIQSQPSVQQTPALSNDNYYVNTAGNTVHSPAYSEDNFVPAGASAQCRDGTYSFSQSHRGTCSHHGGVAEWE